MPKVDVFCLFYNEAVFNYNEAVFNFSSSWLEATHTDRPYSWERLQAAIFNE